MIFTQIWERYLLKEMIKIFGLFLFGFFFLYAAIDYSMHMQDFLKDKKLQILDLCIYYGFQFIKRAPLLLPLALLISTIKVLTSLNTSRELVALQTAGLSFKKLMRPFLFTGVLCALFNILSFELLLPKALTHLDQFYDKYIKHTKGTKSYPLHIFTLKNNTKVVYQSYDKDSDLFFDVIWLQSANEIWRMRYLSGNPLQPEGRYVDHLVRAPDGSFEKKDSFEHRIFKEMSWDRNQPRKGFIPLENRSLQELCKLGFASQSSSYLKMEAKAQLYYKCTMPLLSLLVIVASAPFCVRYSRRFPLFFLYTVSLFGYITFFTLMDSAVILGENRAFSPFAAIFIPFFLCSLPFTINYVKR